MARAENGGLSDDNCTSPITARNYQITKLPNYRITYAGRSAKLPGATVQRNGADPKIRSKFGQTAWSIALQHPLMVSAASQFLAKLPNAPKSRQEDGATALICATRTSSAAVARLLLDRSARVDDKGADGRTALFYCAKADSVQTAKLLLDRGASPTTVDERGLTTLHVAAGANAVGLVKLRIGAGAKVNAAGSDGYTPIMEACSWGSHNAAKLLLANGSNVDDVSNSGHTPLMFAAGAASSDTVELLLKMGASYSRQDARGPSALHYAAKSGDAQSVKRLFVTGADIPIKGDHGEGALRLALKLPQLEFRPLKCNIWGIRSTTDTAQIWRKRRFWRSAAIPVVRGTVVGEGQRRSVPIPILGIRCLASQWRKH